MTTAVAPRRPHADQRPYGPLGAARTLLIARDPEIVVSGPAGTGKSRGCLEKLHLCAERYAGMRGLIVRKTRESMTESALVTYEDKVLPAGHAATAQPILRRVRQSYRYANGSTIVVVGLDKPGKAMSTEYDLIYVMEATEATEDAWEALTTRLRNGKMPYQQLIADCNPGPPSHWLKKRADRGQTVMLESRHEDNPELWDARAGRWTERGAAYIAKLDALTGVRKLRLRSGIWAAAEGMVYDEYDPAVHILPRRVLPAEWPRYWVFDFGYTNPFVWQEWVEDPDGRLILYREIYRTQRLVEDHAKDIRALTKDSPRPRAVLGDHDAEDRATLERHLGVKVTPARKNVSPGLQAVKARLRPAGDGRPRLYLMDGALVSRDASLDDRKLPAATAEEIEGYVWDTSNGRRQGEEPVKANDHGMDALRYLVAHHDLKRRMTSL